MAGFLFLEEGEEYAQQRRKIFLDARRDDALYWCVALDLFQTFVERRQCDDDLDAGGRQRFAKLAAGIKRIQRQDSGACFPRADFCNQKLWAVRQDQRNAISFFDPCVDERCSEAVAQTVEIFVRDGYTFKKNGGRIGT